MNANHPTTPQKLHHLQMVILAGFLLVALVLTFWSVLRGQTLLRRDDNPRLVEAELRIQRGHILDRNGTVLAENSGPTARQQRRYPLVNVGPAVGYYSFRHGTAGIEESYDSLLRGDTTNPFVQIWQSWLHRPPTGQDVRLTLDADQQLQAEALMAEHQGALLLLDLATNPGYAQIRALVSHPGYDPNRLDEEFAALTADAQAPLLNRVTQSRYQPGLMLQPLILAVALSDGVLRLDDLVENANRPVPINGQVTRCTEHPPEPTTWSVTLQLACPGPMLTLAEIWGWDNLRQSFVYFGLTTAPDVPLPVAETAVSWPNPLTNTAISLAALGQGALTVTPLQMGLAYGALANQGQLPLPQLVTAVQTPSGSWQGMEIEVGGETAVSPTAAATLYNALPQTGPRHELQALVLSGPDGRTNAWYIGFAPAIAPRYLVVIVLEQTADSHLAQEIGRQILATRNESP